MSISTMSSVHVPGRFASLTDSELSALDEAKDAKSTKRTVKRSVDLFRNFLGENCDFESFTKEELNSHLRKFFACVRKTDGSDLKKSSLQSLRYGLSRYLSEICDVDLIHDKEFASCKATFKGKMVDLKKQGKGGVEHKPEISEPDLLKLRDPHNLAFDTNTPCGLQKKVWFDIMYFLCRRGQENLREMKKATFAVSKDATGRRFVQQVIDEADKNHGASSAPDDTIGEAKMFEKREDPMCPVMSFEKYMEKLSPGIEALWQRPLDTFHESDSIWYAKAPVGKNALASWMPDISELAGLSKRYTNHCIRATSTGVLDRAGHEARHIMRVTGHKSEASIRSYSRRLTEKKQRDMSNSLAKAMEYEGSNYSNISSTETIKNSEIASENHLNKNAVASVAGLETISDLEILELFSNDNDFVELDQRENIPPPTNIGAVSAREASTEDGGALQSSHLNYYSQQIIAQPQPQFRPIFNINPNMNNCVVHFHCS